MGILNKFKKRKTESTEVPMSKEVLSDTDAFGYDFLAYGLMLASSFQCKETAMERLRDYSDSKSEMAQGLVTIAHTNNSLADINIAKKYLYILHSIGILHVFNMENGTTYTINELVAQYLPKADLPTMYKKVTHHEYQVENSECIKNFLDNDMHVLYDKLEELIKRMDEKYDPETCVSTVVQLLQELYQKHQFPESEQISFIRKSEDAILLSFKPIDLRN